MTDRILFVDDEPNILDSYRRQLKNRFRLDTASSGARGLEAVSNRGPYAVIVSDLRMPGMDGIQFLSRVRETAPETVRIMLTGFADLGTAIQAVNDGNIFRFLTKPCPPNVLIDAITSGIQQYRLVTAERELLEKTLRGSIQVLTEVLGLLNPEAFGRSQRITRYVRKIASHMKVPNLWQVETAAMLSHLGCIILPEDVQRKKYQGEELTEEESRLFQRHPSVASKLLAHIPRMEEIGKIIEYQEKHFNGGGVPHEARRGEDIPLGARVLKAVLDFDALLASGTPKSQAVAILKQRTGRYDPAVLAALEAVIGADEAAYEVRTVNTWELVESMILAEDVRTLQGVLLVPKGVQISRPTLERLSNFARNSGVREPIEVFVPVAGK